jgi:hypothetical protein
LVEKACLCVEFRKSWLHVYHWDRGRLARSERVSASNPLSQSIW